MSDQPEVKRTRRAKRREEKEAEQTQAAEGSAAPPAEAEPAAPAESAKPKRKAKAKASGTEEIRDRNRRLREQAAQRRRGKRDQEEREAPARGLGAGEMVDDALSRSTQALGSFIKKNVGVLQWLVVIGIVAGVAWQIYGFRKRRETAKSADVIAKAVEAELGRVVTEQRPEPKEIKDLVNPVPQFTTDEARIKAAEKAYRDVAASATGPTKVLTDLGLAGVAYDAARYDEAKKLYESVKTSELAGKDADVKARATEGAGLALEAKGDKEAALKAFHELESSDTPAFSLLGLYHQARVQFVKGERDKAKELLKRVREKLEKLGTEEQQEYLQYASNQLMKLIDPSEAASSSPGAQYTPEQLEALQKQIASDPSKLTEMLKNLGKAGKGMPKSPAAPAPAPEPAPAPAPAPQSSGTP